MKILRVVHSMNPSYGGPCQGIRSSILEMKRLGGFDNEVVCFDDPYVDYMLNDEFIIHRFHGSGPWSFSFQLIPWLLENLCRFDAVVIHGLWQYYGFAVYRAIKKIKENQLNTSIPKLFVMPHGMLDPYFQIAKGRRLKAIRNSLYWKVIEQRIVNYADTLLFTCAAEQRLAELPFSPYRPKKELNVGYGISKPPLFENSMRVAFQTICPDLGDRKYFLFLGRIHPKKGVDILINAYKELLEGAADLPIPALVIAGPGLDSSFGRVLQDAVQEVPVLKESVYFPGMLVNESKWGAFYDCEAFILPSHQENFGIAVVEALACSKPVLISNQVNICEEISSSNAGIVSRDTVAGVFELFDAWINLSPTEKEAMGFSARECYSSFFSIERATLNLIDALTINNIGAYELA